MNIQANSQVPSFDFFSKSQQLTGQTGSVLTASIPAALPNRMIYFGLLLNDLILYDVRGRLEFLLDQSAQQLIQVRSSFPISINDSAQCLPIQWTRVESDSLSLASDYDLSQSADLDSNEVQFRTYYKNSHDNKEYYYIVRLGGFFLRGTFNKVQLNLDLCLLGIDTNHTPGKAMAFLGVKSWT